MSELHMYDIYEEFYKKIECNTSFSRFCQAVYDIDLSQDGFSNLEQIEAMLAELRLTPDSKILDIGCGNGKLCEYIRAQTGAEVFGFDYSPSAIESAKKRLPEQAGHFAVANIDSQCYPELSFDAIVSVDTLYFTDDLKALMGRILRWLKPGGVFAAYYMEDNRGPDETQLAKILRADDLTYKTADYSTAHFHIMRLKHDTALSMQDELEHSGLANHTHRMLIESFDESVAIENPQGKHCCRRYLYTVTKPGIAPEKLTYVLGKMLDSEIISADYQTTRLHGGTLGDVQLVEGEAVSSKGEKIPYKLVLKTQKKWQRYGDPGSWRREYDLYTSDLGAAFGDSLRWPRCYHAEINGGQDQIQLWMEYIDGVSGLDLTADMYELAAAELGRFQGRLYAQRPAYLQELSNLSGVDYAKSFYLHYRSWKVVYDYIRDESCEIPRHLCQMLIDIDDSSDAIFSRIGKLPVVLCHRDFWVANIFCTDGKIRLIDWDTAGWGPMGEDLASLIADEADTENMAEHYRRCVAAYYKGFAEHVDVSHVTDNCVYELILVLFGYRLVEWYLNAKTAEGKAIQIETLEKIYEMKPR